MRNGHKYGLGNVALFFANGLEISIENEEQCDEHNRNLVSGKLPLSNSCGQRGLSYQDMSCPEDGYNGDDYVPDMACPVDTNMEMLAVTFGKTVGSAPALQCAPKSEIPWTGYWDFEAVEEVTSDAYANENGRVDVEGGCVNVWSGMTMLMYVLCNGLCGSCGCDYSFLSLLL